MTHFSLFYRRNKNKCDRCRCRHCPPLDTCTKRCIDGRAINKYGCKVCRCQGLYCIALDKFRFFMCLASNNLPASWPNSWRTQLIQSWFSFYSPHSVVSSKKLCKTPSSACDLSKQVQTSIISLNKKLKIFQKI